MGQLFYLVLRSSKSTNINSHNTSLWNASITLPILRIKKKTPIKSQKIRKILTILGNNSSKNKLGSLNFFYQSTEWYFRISLNLNLDIAMHMKCPFSLLKVHTAALGYFTDCIHISLPTEWLKSQKTVRNIALTFCYIIIYSAFHLRKTPLNVISSSSS